METKIYNQLPDEAKEIRLEVFVKEQGFEEEFDDIDETAAHIVLFDSLTPSESAAFSQTPRAAGS